MLRSVQVRELGVKLLVGVMVALAIVYLPMSDAVRKAELARALEGVGFGSSTESWPGPDVWRVLYAVGGLVIAGAVYWSFEAPWRASKLVVGLSLVALALAFEKGRGILAILVVFAAIGGSIALTIWHDRWLGDYEEDEPA